MHVPCAHIHNIQRMALSVDKSTSGYIANQEAGVAFSEQDRIEIKRTGKEVRIKNNIYDRTNHYIKASHGYVPEDKERKLTCYWYFTGLQWVFLAVFVVGLVSPSHFIFALTMGGISILFIVCFSQHMYVVITTIPIILKLPHQPDNAMKLANDFYEISLEKYTAIFAASPDTAVGMGVKTKGMIKIHVLSTRARRQVTYTIVVSILALVASIFMIIYCFALGVYRAWQVYPNI